MLDNVKNGGLAYYQDGYFKIDEIRDGTWVERQRTWMGKFNPDKMLVIKQIGEYYFLDTYSINKKNTIEWFNFKTGVFEVSEGPQTDEEALQYIPDIPAAHGLFQVHRLMGKSIEESLIEVLTACIGDKPPKPKKWWEFWK